MRHEWLSKERALVAENEALKAETTSMSLALETALTRAGQEVRAAERNAQQEAAALASEYRSQLVDKEDEVAHLSARMEHAARSHADSLRRLKEKVATKSRLNKRLASQKALEAKGFAAEIDDLKRQVRLLERDLYATGGDPDARRYELHLLNTALAAAGTKAELTGRMNHLKNRTSRLEDDIAAR